jgi:siroheme synthase
VFSRVGSQCFRSQEAKCDYGLAAPAWQSADSSSTLAGFPLTDKQTALVRSRHCTSQNLDWESLNKMVTLTVR